MNAKTAAALEEIKKLLDVAANDEAVPLEDYADLVESLREHCDARLDQLEEEEEEDEEEEDEEEEEEELVDDSVKTDINDDGKVGGS